MIKALGKFFSRAVTPIVDIALRRWEAAETHHHNAKHWARAHETPINADLYSDLNILRTRATFESRRNPTVAGVIDTYGKDVSGREGPMLRVISPKEKYNQAAQDLWWELWHNLDIAGRMGGVDLIRLWVGNLFTCGEYIAQIVHENDQKVLQNASEGLKGVTLRIKAIDPRRLKTPMLFVGDGSVVMGIKLSEVGRPLEYYIAEPIRLGGVYGLDIGKFTTVSADDMIHEFVVIEADQARGVPWLAVSLESVAESRDYDKQVMNAARNAADYSITLETTHPDLKFEEVNAVEHVEGGTMSTLPPGYEAKTHTPPQPSTQYLDFKGDRKRDIGRPIGMPLMMVQLGSEEHNFSSARFDGEIYKRGVGCTREHTERRALNPLVIDVLREAELYAIANPGWKYAALARRPKELEFLWIWQPLPHVDPEKAAAEQETLLKNGTLTFDEACAMAGKDADTQIAKAADVFKKFVDAKIPFPAWMTAGMQNAGIQIGKDGSIKMNPGMAQQGVNPEESQTEFLRKVLLAFLADKTTNDVFFNIIDDVELAKKTGVPVEAETLKNPDTAVPYLPIIADNNQPVTGEVTKDSTGDVVGGTAKEPPAPVAPGNNPTPKAQKDPAPSAVVGQQAK